MNNRIDMSMEDLRTFTTHAAHQNELRAAKAVANTGNCYPEGTARHEATEPMSEKIAELGTGDGM